MNSHAQTSTTLNLTHLEDMTDTIGILEHCLFTTPERNEGYATDDNARALQVVLRLGSLKPPAYIQKYVSQYLQFIFSARTAQGFHQDLNANLSWKDDVGVNEGFGRALAALAEAAVTAPSPEQQLAAAFVFDQQLPLVILLNKSHTRAIAQTIIALSYRHTFETSFPELMPLLIMRKKLKGDQPVELPLNVMTELTNLAETLVSCYASQSTTDWHWFEPELTYDNGRLPLGLLHAFQQTGVERYKQTALEALDFLLIQTFDREHDCFSFPGYRGWLVKGHQKALFGQQPIEAGSTVEVCVLAYEITGDQKYLDFANTAFEWYGGRNILGLNLINPVTGGIKDGLEEWGLNPNEGAESILSYALAYLALKKVGR